MKRTTRTQARRILALPHNQSFFFISGVGRDQGGMVDFESLTTFSLTIECGLCVGKRPLPSEFQFHVHPYPSVAGPNP